ncbi:histidine phosphatase family protein [Faecalibaculum rodentium]|uniref:histidine phosphatase family protein n=1 Tax=Faecalibaculum rodentium TaxID=1702221 RepID=UPI001C3DC66F|nr:histidine phosphatase family protein [Faecalibaculum rodentium]
MKKKLYLMRHGQTMFNEQDRVQGVCDSPLTEKGKEQALYTRDHFFREREIQTDLAISSTQERASDTLELVTEQPYDRLKGIKEMSFGLYEGWLNKMVPRDWETSLPHYGGELFSDAGNRMKETLTEVMKQPDTESVLAVSHGCAIRAFLTACDMKPPRFNNCSVAELDWDPETGIFSLSEIWQNPLL